MKKMKYLPRDRYMEWFIRNFDPNQPESTPGRCPFLSRKKEKKRNWFQRVTVGNLMWEGWGNMSKRDVLREWRLNKLEYGLPDFLNWEFEDPFEDDF